MQQLFYLLIILIIIYVLAGEYTNTKKYITNFVEKLKLPNIPLLESSSGGN
jgi:hypothetical protein